MPSSFTRAAHNSTSLCFTAGINRSEKTEFSSQLTDEHLAATVAPAAVTAPSPPGKWIDNQIHRNNGKHAPRILAG